MEVQHEEEDSLAPLNHCLGLFQCQILRIFIFAESAHLLFFFFSPLQLFFDSCIN